MVKYRKRTYKISIHLLKILLLWIFYVLKFYEDENETQCFKDIEHFYELTNKKNVLWIMPNKYDMLTKIQCRPI